MSETADAHLVALHDEWRAWRVIRLRGTGFPAHGIDAFAMPEAVRQAERVAAADAAVDQIAGRSRAAVETLVRRVAAGTPVPDELAAVVTAHTRERAAFTEVFDRERLRVSEEIRTVLLDPRVREAVTWQNRRAYEHGIRSLHTPGPLDKRRRQREQTVMMYVQRYCVKNDTIGFFGPVSWATASADVLGVVATPAGELLARRTVYFEYWGIKALADHVAADSDVLPFMAPRLHPGVRLADRVLHHPVDGAVGLTEVLAAVLAACDGVTRASTIASRVGLEDPDEVYVILADLADRGVVIWTVEVSPEALRPEHALRAALSVIDDDTIRARALVGLDRLEACRGEVADAAGDPDRLALALAQLDDQFESSTGHSASRHAGQTYGGRQLVYEDCRRGIEVQIGTDVLARVGPACALVLQSARWYTHEIARRYRIALDDVFDRTCSGRTPLRRFWDASRGLFSGGAGPDSIVGQVAETLRRAWTEIFAVASGESRVDRSVAMLRTAVARTFAAPGPGWPNARYQSLDLMIAAADVSAIARGDYLVVLGELHPGINTVLSPVFSKEYPALDELLAWRAADLREPCIAPAWSFNRSRADYFSMVPGDLALETGAARSWRVREHVIAESSCEVERIAGTLCVHTRDGRHRFDVIAFLEHHLIAESHAHFRLAASSPHSPRLALDGLVLARETWRVSPAEVPPALAGSPASRFLAAQQWRRQLGLPRRVFVSVPEETKPIFVDFESSLAIDNLAKIVRQASRVTLSEMLPDPDQLWLRDARGQAYTSELRLAAVDPVRFCEMEH